MGSSILFAKVATALTSNSWSFTSRSTCTYLTLNLCQLCDKSGTKIPNSNYLLLWIVQRPSVRSDELILNFPDYFVANFVADDGSVLIIQTYQPEYYGNYRRYVLRRLFLNQLYPIKHIHIICISIGSKVVVIIQCPP
jgi:hypothetical protein